ncbi:MAG: phosphodiesterase [Caldisericaceae bacterium]|jgi:putative phosphoesterase|nr:phosphodiesterase [Caldisericaceae bacterium]
MKIGVISDLHGSFEDVKNALGKLISENIDLAICAGDVLYHGPRNPIPESYNPAKVAELLNNFPKRIIFAKGNCDSEVDQMIIKYPMLSDFSYVYAEGVFIAITHGHKIESFKEFGEKVKADIVISGHTHIPVIEKFENSVHLNPGSVTFPKGGSRKSYAIIKVKDGKFEIELKEI